MHKLASVFKPERRQQLIQQGYNIVGTFGDQYSDLEGTSSAVASYKLPNPLYYIL
jgi:predicted secreted acid phosphatase